MSEPLSEATECLQACPIEMNVTIFTSTLCGALLLALLYTEIKCAQTQYYRTLRLAIALFLVAFILWHLPDSVIGIRGSDRWLRVFIMWAYSEVGLFAGFRFVRRLLTLAFSAVSGESSPTVTTLIPRYIRAAEITCLFIYTGFFFGAQVSMFKPRCSIEAATFTALCAIAMVMLFGSLFYANQRMRNLVGFVETRLREATGERTSVATTKQSTRDATQLDQLTFLLKYFKRVGVALMVLMTCFSVFVLPIFISEDKQIACRPHMRYIWTLLNAFYTVLFIVHTYVSKERQGPSSLDRKKSNTAGGVGGTSLRSSVGASDDVVVDSCSQARCTSSRSFVSMSPSKPAPKSPVALAGNRRSIEISEV